MILSNLDVIKSRLLIKGERQRQRAQKQWKEMNNLIMLLKMQRLKIDKWKICIELISIDSDLKNKIPTLFYSPIINKKFHKKTKFQDPPYSFLKVHTTQISTNNPEKTTIVIQL